jgi:hypothetical protein
MRRRRSVLTPPATTASLGGGEPGSGVALDELAAAHDAAIQMIDTFDRPRVSASQETSANRWKIEWR